MMFIFVQFKFAFYEIEDFKEKIPNMLLQKNLVFVFARKVMAMLKASQLTYVRKKK